MSITSARIRSRPSKRYICRERYHLPVSRRRPVAILARPANPPEGVVFGRDRPRVRHRTCRRRGARLLGLCRLSLFMGRRMFVKSTPRPTRRALRLKLADDVLGAEKLYREKHRPLPLSPAAAAGSTTPMACLSRRRVALFYQQNPYGREWGNMHWGHAVSSDSALERTGIGLTPRSTATGLSRAWRSWLVRTPRAGRGSSERSPARPCLYEHRPRGVHGVQQ